jgi:hypothetical protein
VAHNKIDPHRRLNSFEIFGFDFMLDEDFVLYLIEVNTNPCLEIASSTLLARIIPNMLESAFRIAVDPILHPTDLNFKRGQEFLAENKFRHVFDYETEREAMTSLYDLGADRKEDLNVDL